MSYIPPEISHQILDYLDGNDWLIARRVSESFMCKVDPEKTFTFVSDRGTVPSWVRKIKVGPKIEDIDLVPVTQITHLDLTDNYLVTGKGIKNMRNITHLVINSTIPDKYLTCFPKMTHLDIKSRGTTYFSQKVAMNLTALTHLVISPFVVMRSLPILLIPNLISLKCSKNVRIDKIASDLIKIRYLDIRGCDNVDIEDLLHLPLETLWFNNYKNDVGDISIMTLKELHLTVKEEDMIVKGHPELRIFYK